MKGILKTAMLVWALSALVSCEEMFKTNPDDITNAEDYISVEDEIYKGFLGILTKMQQAGDHAIILTDTRGDFLEVTRNAPLELQQIYNYDATNGNTYADPTCYYAVVVACNDYIAKMTAYREKEKNHFDENTMENFDRLISSTLRLKVWAYLSLGRIYGEALWFDDPLESLKDINDESVFTPCNMSLLVEKCLDVLDNGIVLGSDSLAIPADLEMNWAAWIDTENTSTSYDHWQYVTPSWLMLYCDLLSWRGTTADYQLMKDMILSFLYKVHNNNIDYGQYSDFYYACNIPLIAGDPSYNWAYYQMFYVEQYNASSKANLFQVINGIMYDYENGQTNRIVEYFCPQTPGKYYLRPSAFSIGKYIDEDTRSLAQRFNMNVINGDTCFSKYYYFQGKYLRDNIVEIQPVIPVYRGHDFHFWLAEAENHLGNWRQAEVILNAGVTNEFANKILPKNWDTRYNSWFCPAGGYGDVGIVGCVRGRLHDLPSPKDAGYALSEEERMKIYDMAILDEALLEYAGEGRSYSMMVRMAELWNDPSIVADRVCPKYQVSQRDAVRAAIEAGGYWVDWDLQSTALKGNAE